MVQQQPLPLGSERGPHLQFLAAAQRRAPHPGPHAHEEPLLLEEPEAQQASTPVPQCGVSLAWLQRFAKHCRHTGHSDCTEQLASRLVVPLCKTSKQGRCRLWDLVPPQDRGPPDWYIVHTWSDCFVSMIQNLVHHLVGGAEALRVKKTKKQQSMSSRRTSSVGEVMHSARSIARDDPLPSARSAHGDAKERQEQLLSSTYVWLDVVALNQHALAMGPAGGPALDLARAAITAARLGTLICVDPHMEVLSRAWCMYECWASVYYGEPQRLQVVFADGLTLEDLANFQHMCQNMDLTRSNSSRPADKQRILAEVKHKVGLRRMQQLLPDALMRSARSGLRWSSVLRNVSMYCAMLLKSREWHQVATVLNTIPEIHDDEKTLQDIRDVFHLYDQDGSGELDKEEFIEVLGVAGFDHEEAVSIFDSVDVDGGGSVSLEEFENWWIESQRSQSTQHHSKCDYTLDALITSVKAMLVLLERHHLQQHVPFFTSSLAMLQGVAARSARQGGAARPLLPSEVKGDWHGVAEQCAWKVSSRDFRGAANLMYSLLLWNADTLPEDPDTSLTPPSTVQGLKPLLQLLVGLMRQFGDLLARIPTNFRQAEYFRKAAQEVHDTYLEPLLELEEEQQGLPRAKSRRRGASSLGLPPLKNHNRFDDGDGPRRPTEGGQPGGAKASKGGRGKGNSKGKGSGKPRLFPTRFDMQRGAIVSDMVKLKYGPGTLISAQHIVEAEKSLSAWMAGQRTSAMQGAHKDEREAVAAFTTQYLSSFIGGAVPRGKASPGGGDEDAGGRSLPAIKGAQQGGEGDRAWSDTPNRQHAGRNSALGGHLPALRASVA